MDRSPMVVVIQNADLTAEISDVGAELFRLTVRGNQEYLWNGDPAFGRDARPCCFQ